MAATELAAVLLLAYITFSRRLRIGLRKGVFVGIIHLTAAVLLFQLGTLGPGMLYLLAGTFFAALIFPGRYAWWSTVAVTTVCLAFGLALQLDLTNVTLSQQYSLSSWIVVSCNLVILSAVFVLMQSRLFWKLGNAFARYRSVARATRNTVYDWDLKEDRVQYNDGIHEMFGYTQKEVTSTNNWWIERLHEEDRDEVVSRFSDMVFQDEQEIVQMEHRFLCANGQYKHVYHCATVVRDVDGKKSRIVGSVEDITELKNYISTIEKQNRSLKQISWVHSHKVRSPVATILGLVPLMNDHNLDTEENKLVLEGIVQSCNELDTVIREITDLSEQELQE